MTTILFFVLMAILVNALALVLLYLKYIGKLFTNRKPTIIQNILQKENFNEIIGKSQTVLCQEKPSEANQRQIYKPINEDVTFVSSESNNRSAIVDESEFPTIFSETPIHLDIEMEYEVLIEEDEIIRYSGETLENVATGIDFEEMNNLVHVINQKTDKPEQEQQAWATIMKIGQTDLFEQMLSQIELGHVRVEMMLNKYETKKSTTPTLSPDSIDDDFEKFELNRYL